LGGVDTTAAGGDLSLLGLFLQADLVVKTVMLLLLAASVWVWAIVFEKTATLRRVNRAATQFEDRFWSGGSLDELYEAEGARPTHPVAAVFGAAMGEWRRSAQVAGADVSRGGVRDRVDRTVAVTVQREMDRMERWMVFLASVGSTAPFIGLFGTVWGIMRSFSAIATSRNTNLSVVAPRRRCSPPQSASSPPFPPCWPTTRSVRTCPGSPRGWRVSAASSPASCPGNPRSGRRSWRVGSETTGAAKDVIVRWRRST